MRFGRFIFLSRLGLALLMAIQVQSASAATLFGVYAGGGVWSQEIEGSATSDNPVAAFLSPGINVVDLEDDLGFDDKRNFYAYAGLEHPIPFLPNVRVDYTEISQRADGVLDRGIVFNGRAFNVTADVFSEVDLDQTDLILYYELLDNVVSIDLGLGVRYVDGFVRVADGSSFSSADFSGAIPLAYVGGRFDLPLTGYWIGAQARGLAYRGDSLIDIDARVGWESDLGFGLELGYRFLDLDLDDFDDIDSADLRVKGPFAGLTFSF